MNARVELSSDQRTLLVTVPFAARRRGGRKRVLSPDGATAWAPQWPQVDGTLVKALARAFRWRRLLEEGAYASCAELAAAQKINPSYVSRILRLTLLAPDIVVAVLDGRQTPALAIARLLKPFPAEWHQQRRALWTGEA